MLSRFKKPDGSLAVDGIFCPNESTTFGMLRVLEDSGWAGKVKFVGFDASDTLVKGLADGHIDALVLQDPVKMGYLGVKTLVAHIKGFPVEKRVDTGVQLVTRDATASEDSVISVHTPDVEGAYEEAQKLGYEIVKPIATEPWGVRRFFVRAPDGNVINIAYHPY